MADEDSQAARRLVVTAPDGVRIIGAASGAGPGVAFVYGAMMEQTGWSRLLAHLPGLTLYTYDRRGRGESTDAPEFSIQAEVDDLKAFIAAIPQPLDLLGHSSGALLVLDAVTQGAPVRRLVFYEPVLPAVREPKVPADLPGRIRALVAAGDPGGAMEAFMRDGMWLGDADIERAKASDRWQDQLRYVGTAANDVTIAREYELVPERLAKLEMPVLLLVGSESPAWMQEGVRRFAAALPDARLEVLEGQGHNAMFSAPALLAEKVLRFIS
jgi:pimeloyl-ACP methyl ester carboxylesterase